MGSSWGLPRRDFRPCPLPWFREQVCPSLIYLLFLSQGLTGAKGEPGPMGIPGVKVSGLLGTQLGPSKDGAVGERSRDLGDPSL